MMHGFSFGFGGIFGMILIWVLLIAGSVWLIKVLFSGGINSSSRDTDRGDQALDILNKRYAFDQINIIRLQMVSGVI